MAEEMILPQWLKSLPVAPEFHPTFEEFKDPISYIFKIEQEASQYGICKIIPPCSVSSKKGAITNQKQLLSSQTSNSSPKFTTRHQQVGLCPHKKLYPFQRPIWQSGETYTLPQFEAKARAFASNWLKERWNSNHRLLDVEIETLYWKAQDGNPFSVEYGNYMLGSAFDGTGSVGEPGSDWNLGSVSRAEGSLLRFVKEDIPGVTSAMVHIGMLFSWFAWHVEDHDLHSLNYMHMDSEGGKTWYGVPREAAFAFEDVIRTYAYCGEISPTVTFATIGEKTTIVSPEVLVKAGVPCCRLVQNAGEFVVTFPRAYHSGFSHGFNCAEATNIATPAWLRVAGEAAIRRVSVNSSPMISHQQLLYDLALSLSSRTQENCTPEPQSSQVRDPLKIEADEFVKKAFIEDIIKNNQLLHTLGKDSPITLLTEDVLKSLIKRNLNTESDVDRLPRKELYSSYCKPDKKVDPACVFSCVTCGSPCYSCVAIVQLSQMAANYLMSKEDANSSGIFADNGSTTGEQIEISALYLLALSYGDLSDEEGSNPTKFVMESNHTWGSFESTREVPNADKESSLVANEQRGLAHEKNLSIMHVFCLQHALEIKNLLRSISGVHMLLLCHQDYQEINDAARSMGKELGVFDGMWEAVKYRNMNEEDKMLIKWALADEETKHGSQDWAVKLGVDIFYSANLGGSPFYKKQVPYNWVIYNVFGLSNEHATSKQSGNQKIVLAGRWCGQIWMSNKVHPMLAVKDDDKQEDHEKNVPALNMNGKHEKQLVVRKKRSKPKRPIKSRFAEVEASPPPPSSPADSPPSGRFRKLKISRARHVNSEDDSDYMPSLSANRKIKHRQRRMLENGPGSKSKKDQKLIKNEKKTPIIYISDEEAAFGCDIYGCDMIFNTKEQLRIHKANVCLVEGCNKKLFSHRYLLKHMRVHKNERPLKCPWEGCEKTFKWTWARTEHIRVHTGHRPYLCAEEGCGKNFMFLTDFARHKRRTGHAKI